MKSHIQLIVFVLAALLFAAHAAAQQSTSNYSNFPTATPVPTQRPIDDGINIRPPAITPTPFVTMTPVPRPTATYATPTPTPPAAAAPTITSSPAPRTGGTRVGFVDIELVIDNSRAIRKGMNRIDDELASVAREIDLKERDFRRIRFELDRQERVLSQEERDRRSKEMIKLREEIDRMKFEMDQDLQAKERLVTPVLEKLMMVIADVAEREGFDLVLRGEVVIYGSKSVDITSLVVNEVDAREAEILPMFAGARLSDTTTSGTIAPPSPNAPVLPMIP